QEDQAKLKKEIQITDKLVQDYKTLLENAPSGDNIDLAEMQQHALKKKAWLEQCVYAGAINVDVPKTNAAGTATQSTEPPKTQNYIASKITELEKRRALVNIYVPYFSEPSTIT
ncbi:hypothetical protein O4H33_20580, partial [Vibrio sinaloensis]|nr:hypothetical protein [Vibrio sinaloensis]